MCVNSFQLDVDLNSSHLKGCKLKVCIVVSRMLSSSRSLYVHTCCSRLALTRVNQLGTNVPTKCTITQQTHNANKQRANTLCRQNWSGGVQGRRKTLPHTSVQTHTANHQGLRGGFAAREWHEQTLPFLIMPVILLCLLCHGELLRSIRLVRREAGWLC